VSGTSALKTYASRESATPAQRPKLIVNYTSGGS
jgi:hypothetical protein